MMSQKCKKNYIGNELTALECNDTGYINQMVNARKRVLYVVANIWLNLQANYDAELLEFNKEQSITEEERSARKSLKDIVPKGVFKMENNAIDPYVLGAWIIMCQNMADNQRSYSQFEILRVDQLIDAIKGIMQSSTANVQKELKETMACYGKVHMQIYSGFLCFTN